MIKLNIKRTNIQRLQARCKCLDSTIATHAIQFYITRKTNIAFGIEITKVNS